MCQSQKPTSAWHFPCWISGPPSENVRRVRDGILSLNLSNRIGSARVRTCNDCGTISATGKRDRHNAAAASRDRSVAHRSVLIRPLMREHTRFRDFVERFVVFRVSAFESARFSCVCSVWLVTREAHDLPFALPSNNTQQRQFQSDLGAIARAVQLPQITSSVRITRIWARHSAVFGLWLQRR